MRTRLRRTGPPRAPRQIVPCTPEMALDWCLRQGLDPDEMCEVTVEHHSVLKTFRLPRAQSMVGDMMTVWEESPAA